jgi:bifunctional aspartokinase / homoserine dehydrogenase 1
MTDSMRERSERIELRNKLNANVASDRPVSNSQDPSFAPRNAEHGSHVIGSSLASSESLANHPLRSSAKSRAVNLRSDSAARTSEFYPAHVLHPRVGHEQLREVAKKPLRVMKFGGTSVGNGAAIARVVEIVQIAAQECNVVVVVSAMSGVTNKLVEAAMHAEARNRDAVSKVFTELHQRHEAAANVVVHSAAARTLLSGKMQAHLQEGERLCQQAARDGELTAAVRDAITGLGERLSAPLVAAALAEKGVPSEAIDATELVVTDARHGSAEPFMDLTRDRSEARVRPLLRQGIVAVITGFIGATTEGVLTTLGRNSSDYSGTIMGAALDADEVILWTDVDGILTADPKFVPGASAILEMSYLEASNLADLGAKVLHPKTLRALMQRGIPISIRNTFAPDRPGTKITSSPSPDSAGLKALTSTTDAALITVRASSTLGAPEILRRMLASASIVPAHVRLIPQSTSSPSELCVIVPSFAASSTVDALRRDFAQDLACENVASITLNSAVAVITVVGEKVPGKEGFAECVLESLAREHLNVLASAQVSSRCGFSFVVAQSDMKAALIAAHRELQVE